MSHNYLFDTYDYIHHRLAAAEQGLTRRDADGDARQYAAGQVDILCEFERFLGDHFDAKLPRRLRNQRNAAPAECRRNPSRDASPSHE